MQLTYHFSDAELGVAGCAQPLIDNATYLCVKLLEPIRAKFGPVHIHDAYRDPAHNARVGGVATSYHLFDGGKAAADIDVLPTSNQALFDWIRLESGLPFDQVIIETDPNGSMGTVHVQINSQANSRRMALIGETAGQSGYTQAQVN